MNLKIVSKSDKVNWNGKWVYIGESFSSIEKLEKYYDPKKRISLKVYKKEIFDEVLSDYLKWNQSQIKNFKDEKFWLISELSGRNNLNTNLHLYLCQIITLKRILEDENNNEILIICENYFILNCINKNFNIKNKKTSFLSYIFKVNIFFKGFLILVVNFFKVFIKFLIIKIILKLFFGNKKDKFGKRNFLIHTSSVNLDEKNKIQLNYFPGLNNSISDTMHYISISKLSFFRKILNLKEYKKNNIIVIEEYISIINFFENIKNFLLSVLGILKLENFKDYNIKDLIEFEFFQALSSPSLNFQLWSYFNFIKKIDKKIDELVVIDHYENMISEHAMICACKQKKLNAKIKIIGYHHTLSSNEFLPWHSTTEEWRSNFKPDFLISNGKISKEFLISRGNLPQKIINGPALRYEKLILKNMSNSKKYLDKKSIFVPLSQIRDHNIELINKIFELNNLLGNDYFNFFIRPHPNLGIDNFILNKINHKNNYNIQISQLKISELMDKCLICLSMSTGAVYDAIINGNIVINVESELNYCDNYLDFIINKFDFLKTKSLEDVAILLNKLKIDENSKKNLEDFKKVQNYFLEGMNLADSINIKSFQLK